MKHYLLLLTLSFTMTVSVFSTFARSDSPLGQPGDFDQAIVFTADGTLANSDPFTLMMPDPDANGLRDALGWNNAQIGQFQQEAEAFFRDRFGLDFTNIKADSDGIKMIPGKAMFLFTRFSQEMGYRAVYMNGKATNRSVDTMGYIIVIMGTDVKYHGEFGGPEGQPAFPGEILAFGVYHIQEDKSKHRHPHRHKDKPKHTHQHRHNNKHNHKHNDGGLGGDFVFFQQDTPGRFSPEGLIGIFCDVFNSDWGSGKGEGTTATTPLPDGRAHVFIRNTLTFPGRRSDAMLP